VRQIPSFQPLTSIKTVEEFTKANCFQDRRFQPLTHSSWKHARENFQFSESEKIPDSRAGKIYSPHRGLGMHGLKNEMCRTLRAVSCAID
jgi:hypothetical protein